MLIPLIGRSAVVFASFFLVCAVKAAPVVTNTTPIPGATVSTLTTIAVTFNEAVSGVDASDLLINSEGALNVTGTGAGPYTFTFTQPPPGAVSVSWEFDHQIAGLGTGAFAPVDGWSYTLADALAPIVTVTTPAGGSTLGTLTQAEVTFSENVAGVDAGDLLVNGLPTSSVAGSDAGPYVFTFPTPAVGAVSFAWAGDHGITDLAAPANAFGGAGWNVTRSASGAGALVINEFLAANAAGLADENGDRGSWIEIHNPGTSAVNLAGWALTNEADEPGKWVFPSRTLAAGSYLVVFASGKDRRPVSGNLHTNFTLNANGDTLALFTPDSPRVAATLFAPYPVQRYDFSYGPQTGGALRYFSPPRPNAVNGTSTLTAITPRPDFSVTRGFFQDPFQVVLSCADATATIRYTIDGSIPIASSPAYAAPLAVSGTRLIRAVAFGASAIPSETVTHSYVFLDQVLSQPSPPYDNPARADDNTNPPLPMVGAVQFPVAWGSAAALTFPAVQITNLNANQIPADYGMDLEIYNDPVRYDDNGVVNNVTGKTNLERIKQGLRDLPILSIAMRNDDMFGPSGLYPNSMQKGTAFEKACSVEMLLPDGSTAFATTCGIRIHGNASREPAKNPKHGFKLNFKGTFGASSLDYKLFVESPVPEFDDIILRGDFNSSWVHWDGGVQRPKGSRTRDAFCKDTFRAMGRVAGHHRYVNLFINGLYWGTYDPTEQENNGFAAAYFGGDKDDYAVYEQSATIKSGIDRPLPGESIAPYAAMTALPAASANTTYEQFKRYLDVPWFIDYMLLHFFTGHQDWGDDVNKNWYAVRNSATNGKFRYLPWDQENLLWEPSVNRVGVPSPPTGLHPKLVANAQYRLDFADAVHRHMVAPDGALLPAVNIARWNKWRGVIRNAIAGESARWGDYRRDVHQFQNAPYPLYTWNGAWMAENNRLTNTYFPVRTTTVLAQLRSASLYPTLNAPELRDNATNTLLASQAVTPGFQVKLNLLSPAPAGTTSAGTIHFTTDGSDPRVYYTGTVAASAQTFTPGVTPPLTINASTIVKARALNGTTWSALNEATFTIAPPGSPIRITEIMYNPPGSFGGTSAEFIELQNTGALAVDLGGYFFDGVEFICPAGLMLGPGDRLVLANNNAPGTFAATYPGVAVAGYFGGSLENAGERLTLYEAGGRTVVAVSYDDEAGWPTAPDGGGFSLEIIDPLGNPDSPVNWKASNALKGTSGQANSAPPASGLVIHEVLADHAGAVLVNGTPSDYIELKNIGAVPVDLQGWSVVAGSAHIFSTNTIVPPGGFFVLPVALAASGGRAQLKTPTGAAADAVEFGNQLPQLAIGRVGADWTLTSPSVGADNVAAPVAPAAGHVAINEWLSDSAPGQADWLEIYNRHATLPLALRGLYFETSTELYRFPILAFVAPQGFLQLFANEQPGVNQLAFKLPASGTALTIRDAARVALEAVSASDFGAPPAGTSRGRLPDGTATFATFTNTASPGTANYVNTWTGPILHEVLARGESGADWLELHNPTGAAFDLSGMRLRTASSVAAQAWIFPAGTNIPANGFLALSCDPSLAPSALNTGLLLGDQSGALYLFNAADQLVNYVEWGMQLQDQSIGLDAGTWKLLAAPTRGAANAAPAALGAVTALRINEWLAAPVAGGDFFELYNTDANPVALEGLYLTDDPSEVGRTKFQIAPLSFVAGQGWGKWEASGAPQAGRNHVNFSLSPDAENLRLSNNDAALTPIDVVNFGRQLLGVTQGRIADGQTIQSLLAPTPGAANAVLTVPTITTHPMSFTVPQGAPVTFEVSATSAAPLSIQWKLNGNNVTGANTSTYHIPGAQAVHDGSYAAIVSNAAGGSPSNAATLIVSQTFAQWSASRGLTGSAVSDDDGDGLSNAQEFFHNTNPLLHASVSDRAALPQIGVEPPTGVPQFLTLTYRRSARAFGAAVEHELALTLGAWNVTTPAVTENLAPDPATGDSRVRVKFTIQPGDPQGFLRLKLTP